MYFSKLQSKAVGLPCVLSPLTDFLKRNGLQLECRLVVPFIVYNQTA